MEGVISSGMEDIILDGKYRVLRRLGQGAYGEVFLAEHINLNVQRAVKRIRKSKDRLQTGRNEADILKNLNHPGLPTIYDVWEDEFYFYIVEEYIRGTSLKEYVNEKKHLSEKETVHFSIIICGILDYMQKQGGICHLDLKPENIMVNNEKIRLLDFGSGFSGGIEKKHITGTKGYAAPEMYHNGKIDAACDIYAVGRLMEFMYTGTEKGSSHIRYSENLSVIINKCTSHDKNMRYHSHEELLCTLKQSQLRNKATVNPLIIYVFGSIPHIGTTHFSIMLASYFSKKKKRCILELAYNNEKKRKAAAFLYAHLDHISCRSGIYHIQGIDILPDYGGCAVPIMENEWQKYQVIIRDCGVFEGQKPEEAENAVYILLTGHTQEELLAYQEKAREMQDAGLEYIAALNFTDGREFYRIRKEQHMKKAFRIPYCIRPFSFVDERNYLEKTFLSFCEKKKNLRDWCSGFAKWLRRNTFYSLFRQLSVKRNGRKNSSS